MNKPKYYVFPAVIEHNDDAFDIAFPDLPSVFSNGATLAEAVKEGTEALENVLYFCERDGLPVPEPSDINAISGGVKTLIVADMVSARAAWENRAVTRSVTLPAWMNSEAKENNLNVSQILQDALISILGHSRPGRFV